MNRLPWIGALRRPFYGPAVPALLAMRGAWSEAEPDEFLTDAGKLAPGSTNCISGGDPDC